MDTELIPNTDNIRTILNDKDIDDDLKFLQIKYLLEKLSVQFFLVDGALLGAVREKNFIKWDWDIELAVLSKDVMKKVDDIIDLGIKNNFRVENPDRTKNNLKITCIIMKMIFN